jgi:uncharacterized membrane protein (DUF373 family)
VPAARTPPPGDSTEARNGRSPPSQALAKFMAVAEDAVYTLAAVLLAGAALYALGSAALVLLTALIGRQGGMELLLMVLDQILVGLIFVELFYTVRLSIREHILAVEPFLAVALIATVRRILVITAEEQRIVEGDLETFQRLLLELGLLAGLILVLAVAFVLLRRARSEPP